MFPLFVALTVLGLFVYQFHGDARIKWQQRWAAWRPVRKTLIADFHATVDTVSGRERREHEEEVAEQMKSFDKEWEDL